MNKLRQFYLCFLIIFAGRKTIECPSFSYEDRGICICNSNYAYTHFSWGCVTTTLAPVATTSGKTVLLDKLMTAAAIATKPVHSTTDYTTSMQVTSVANTTKIDAKSSAGLCSASFPVCGLLGGLLLFVILLLILLWWCCCKDRKKKINRWLCCCNEQRYRPMT